MGKIFPLGHILNFLTEALNRAAMAELLKPSVSGIVLSPLVLNQLIIARQCMSSISSEEKFKISYYMDTQSLDQLIVVFKLPKAENISDSPIDLSLLCNKLYSIFENNNTYIVMLMDNPFYKIYESITDCTDFI